MKNLFEAIWQDARYAFRIFAKTPIITIVAVLSLALGIGANTAIFSLIDTVMLRLLPVQKPEELLQVLVRSPHGGQPSGGFTNPLWEQVRDQQDVFSGVFGWSGAQFDLAQGGEAHYALSLIHILAMTRASPVRRKIFLSRSMIAFAPDSAATTGW